MDDNPSRNPDLLESANIIPIPGTQIAACQVHGRRLRPVPRQLQPEDVPHQLTCPQMQTIARGEQLFKAQACYGCHKIEGFSKGNIGPELTYEGRSKPLEAIEHQLWDPRYLVGTCVMPYFFAVRAAQHGRPGASLADVVDPRSRDVTDGGHAEGRRAGFRCGDRATL